MLRPSGARVTEQAEVLTDRYKEALRFAADLHHGQLRKSTRVAYLSHLLSVSALVIEQEGSETEAIAGLLHDAIEDQGANFQSEVPGGRSGREALKAAIKERFGQEVLDIVERCTDDEYLPPGLIAEKGSPEEWRTRKSAYLQRLRESEHGGALLVSCADKLHNARAILTDYELHGEDLWRRFTAGSRDQQLWYYRQLAEIFAERADSLDNPGVARLAKELNLVVSRIAERGSSSV